MYFLFFFFIIHIQTGCRQLGLNLLSLQIFVYPSPRHNNIMKNFKAKVVLLVNETEFFFKLKKEKEIKNLRNVNVVNIPRFSINGSDKCGPYTYRQIKKLITKITKILCSINVYFFKLHLRFYDDHCCTLHVS